MALFEIEDYNFYISSTHTLQYFSYHKISQKSFVLFPPSSHPSSLPSFPPVSVDITTEQEDDCFLAFRRENVALFWVHSELGQRRLEIGKWEKACGDSSLSFYLIPLTQPAHAQLACYLFGLSVGLLCCPPHSPPSVLLRWGLEELKTAFQSVHFVPSWLQILFMHTNSALVQIHFIHQIVDLKEFSHRTDTDCALKLRLCQSKKMCTRHRCIKTQ